MSLMGGERVWDIDKKTFMDKKSREKNISKRATKKKVENINLPGVGKKFLLRKNAQPPPR